MKIEIFDQVRVLQHLREYLLSQTLLKDFIHHNPLHACQYIEF